MSDRPGADAVKFRSRAGMNQGMVLLAAGMVYFGQRTVLTHIAKHIHKEVVLSACDIFDALRSEYILYCIGMNAVGERIHPQISGAERADCTETFHSLR